MFIPPPLHEDIEHVAILIGRAPEIVPLATDCYKHCIEMPRIAQSALTRAQLLRHRRAELQTPLADRFVAHRHPALCE